MTHPHSRRPAATGLLCPSRGWEQWRRSPSQCGPGRETQNMDKESPRTQVKNHRSPGERLLGKVAGCSCPLSNLFPEFQIPHLHFSLLIKKAGSQGNLGQSVRVQTRCLLRSQASEKGSHRDSICCSVSASC